MTIACSSDDDSDGGGGSAGDASTAGSSGSAGEGGSGGSAGGGGGSGGRTGTGGGSGAAGEDAGPLSPESGAEPTDGAATDGGSACAELDACCLPLFAANCDGYVQAGDELVCATVQGVLCSGGMMPGGEGGITPGTGGCAALEMCCDQTPLSLQCNAIVATGNDMQCNTVQFLFCP